ncbi:MAG: ABC transporter substrate-binding protein [Caldilineaceae bacterium]|nr:ABC transporter substrate-binding protein [Caldilineaceae bacterium]
MIKPRLRFALGILLLTALLAACTAAPVAAPEAAAPAAGAEAAAGPATQKVVWVSPRGTLEVMDDFNLWVAKELGYFEELGLDVELQPGPLEALAVTKLIAEQQADVGYPSPGVLLSSIDAGMNLVQPWEMMLGQTFNFAVRPDSEIATVQDLAGKTISLGSEGWKVIVDPILVEAGVDPSTVTYLNAGNQWAQAVALGQADAALAWRGLSAQWGAQGLDFKYLIGTDFSSHPSNGYAIRKEDLSDPAKKELWEKFFMANAMAFEFARLNPRAAAQITYEQFPALAEQMTPQLAFDSMVELADLYFGSQKAGLGYGYNDVENWQSYIDTVYELGQIENQYNAGDVVTNELIEAANSFDAARVRQDAESFELNEAWQAVDDSGVPWSTE